jgi:hypothetical protein
MIMGDPLVAVDDVAWRLTRTPLSAFRVIREPGSRGTEVGQTAGRRHADQSMPLTLLTYGTPVPYCRVRLQYLRVIVLRGWWHDRAPSHVTVPFGRAHD